jgi:hypothetical protein
LRNAFACACADPRRPRLDRLVAPWTLPHLNAAGDFCRRWFVMP